MAKITPMMQQYLDIKEQHKDCLLFFRMGDFYEMFFEDALTASRELEITLTGRSYGQQEKAPMCGVPYHSAENYINRLVEKNYKVAICEQVEDAKQSKGIVKREVVRIVTPGTNLNTDNIDESQNNYIMNIYVHKTTIGIAVADITTGEFLTTEVESERKVLDEIAKYLPKELLYYSEDEENKLIELITNRFNIFVNRYDKWNYEYDRCKQAIFDHFNIMSLDGLGLKEYTVGVNASGALLNYLLETQKRDLDHISKISPYSINQFMLLDISSRRNLELTETLREKKRKGSLLWVLDKTRTAMGARKLRKWIEQPLLNEKDIHIRLDGVEAFYKDPILREELKELLDKIYDIERIMSKVIYGTVNARDMISLRNSLDMIPHIKQLIVDCDAKYQKNIYEKIDTLEDIFKLISDSIIEEPPITIREGNIIKDGYDEEVDKYRQASRKGKQWIADLEQKEKEETGIKNLKIRYNKVFGYYLEVTKSYLSQVPERYMRKQTLANAERYITPELKEIENTVLGAEEKVVKLEYDLFVDIRNKICDNVERIQQTANYIAEIDVLRSLSDVAEKQNYIKPIIDNSGVLDIKEGRHPVVEKMISQDQFINNDTYLDKDEHRFSIITGPNMAGKSTYMRQVALISLMAQIGSFVPAIEAHIGIVDRIFTRVGASDDLSSGQSTFMVEMTEVANILNNATEKSLLILDEIGRGTSTFDGLSIAWAVVEYISDVNIIGAKALFATHYHELTELEGKISGVQNYCVTVKETEDSIVFLRKIAKGGADQSYGIEVAKLAGLPTDVLSRAKEILDQLNQSDINKKRTEIISNQPIKQEVKNEDVKPKDKIKESSSQMSLFNDETTKLINTIKQLQILEMNPMEAMQTLYDLHKKAKDL